MNTVTIQEYEDIFINHFIAKSERKRVVGKLQSKKRQQFLGGFNFGNALFNGQVQWHEIPSNSTLKEVNSHVNRLTKIKLPDSCYGISYYEEWDKKILSRDDGMAIFIDAQMITIVVINRYMSLISFENDCYDKSKTYKYICIIQ